MVKSAWTLEKEIMKFWHCLVLLVLPKVNPPTHKLTTIASLLWGLPLAEGTCSPSKLTPISAVSQLQTVESRPAIHLDTSSCNTKSPSYHA